MGQLNVDQVVRVGRNALYFEDYVLSIQYFNQAIGARPDLARPYFYRAIAKYSLDDMRGAIADASLAIERNPFITDAYELRGVARQNIGKAAEAIDDYRAVLRMMPVNKSVMFNLAMAQQEAGMVDSARLTFQRLFELSPSYDRAYIGYANLLLEEGDTVLARQNIDRALELDHFNVNALLMRANLAIKSGSDGYAQALKDMDEVIRLEPRRSAFFVNRAFLRHELDDYYGAMSDFDYALQLDPDNVSALFNRAMMRAEVADLDRAVADLNRVVALTGSRDYRALFNRAMINKDRGRMEDALADAEAIVKAFPDMAAAYFLRFDIREAMHDRHARDDYDRSIALARKRKTTSSDNDHGSPSDGLTAEEDAFMNFDPENSDAIAGRFTALITQDTTDDTEGIAGAFGARGSRQDIRGRVQDSDDTIELEPIFVATYYSSPSELKPSGDYMKEAEEVNNTRALRYLIQITNHEAPLTDPDEIRRHFESVEYYNSYIATHQPRAIDFFGRGMDFMTIRDYASAINDFSQAITLAPDFALAFFMRSIARLRAAESTSFDEAHNPAAEASKATAADNAQLRRAAILDAIADIDSVIALSPHLAIAHYNKGVVYAGIGDFTSALSAFSRAIELKPDMGEAYYNRGYVYFRLGNSAAGAADLSHAGQLGIVPSYSLLKRMSRP